MPTSSKNRFKYWDETLLSGYLPRPKANRYVVFDIDHGGLNNIRLAFEYVVVLTALTGRTLVIPPRSSWYLINRGPMPEDKKGGTTSLSDIYNLNAISSVIPVISTEEFIEVAANHLDIPEKFHNSDIFSNNLNETNQAWRKWLLDNTEIPGWDPHQTVICMPDIETAMNGPHMNKQYLDTRTPVEFSARMQAAPVLYFPSSKPYRSLGPVATMLAGSDDTIPTLGRRLLKHHVRYRDEIFDLANKIIDALGLDAPYDALQIRRNDFQYKRTRTSTEAICDNIRVLFDENLPVYVATDESRKEVFDDLSGRLNASKVLSWQNVEAVIKDDIPYAWIGPLEQLICTAARRFVGTELSTFCTYITRLRGYTLAEDQNSYYHNQVYTEIPETDDISKYRGRTYLKEHPLLWLAC